MEPILKCPACNGRIALWAVRAEFTCHHCGRALRSNRADALVKAFWVAVSIEALFLLLLSSALGVSSSTFVLWGCAGGVIGYFGGWFALKHLLVIRPIRRSTMSAASGN